MDNKSYAFRAFIDVVTRRRRPGIPILTLGVTLMIALLSGLAFEFSFTSAQGPIQLSLNLESGFAAWATYIAFGIAAGLIALGVRYIITDLQTLDRKRVFAIEIRGLRDWNGAPLSDFIPQRLIGRRELIPVDVRQKITDGKIESPETAVRRTTSLRRDMDTREHGLNRSDVSYVVGGLAPVPLLFLAGIILDDESPLLIMDWDRDRHIWREVEGPDDGNRFSIDGVDLIPPGSDSVILVVSASYKVNLEAAKKRCPSLPVVHFDLLNSSTSSHWSLEKQQALVVQFRETIVNLEGRGIRNIHLFLASPSSLAIRFGTQFDKRNFPALTVYQFEPGAQPSFSWGVRMPVSGQEEATVVN